MGNINKSRVFLRNRIIECETNQQGYALWLSFRRGVRAVYRGIGDTTPVYSWDYVDR